MPAIDFDSDNPSSYLKRAEANGTVYSEKEFSDLLEDNSPVVLNGVVYVKGNVRIKKRQSLTVNGTLVADGNIYVGLLQPFPADGNAYLTINKLDDNSPSGLISKGKILIGVHASNTNLNGLVYALDEIYLHDFASVITINGGLIAREVNIFNLWQPINITYDSNRIDKTIHQEVTYSPTVEVEYWEEEY